MCLFSQDLFDSTHGLWFEKHIATKRAHFRRNMVDDDDAFSRSHRVDDPPFFILSGTALNAAFHLCHLRWVGASHFGWRGS
jgi:hypothetical protein